MVKIDRFEDVVRFTIGKGKRPPYVTCAYFIDGLLIDTGCHHARDEFLNAISKYKIDVIINTHYHEDHVGGNALFSRKLNVPIYASKKTIKLLPTIQSLIRYRKEVWGIPEPFTPEEIGKYVKTENLCFEVIDIPGHSVDHIALVERRTGYVFCGDLFLTERPAAISKEQNLLLTVMSIDKLIGLNLNRMIIFPGNPQLRDDGKEALINLKSYIFDLCKRTGDLLKDGLSEDEILRMLFKRPHWMGEVTEKDISTENLIEACIKEHKDVLNYAGEGYG